MTIVDCRRGRVFFVTGGAETAEIGAGEQVVHQNRLIGVPEKVVKWEESTDQMAMFEPGMDSP